MSTIEVAVAGRGIQVKQGYEKPSAGDVNTCSVSLAIESGGVWDSLPHKRVTFATRTASVTVDYAPTIAIPHEVMASPGALYLTLTGYDADGIEVARTHRMTYPIEVARAGADEGAEPTPATLDVVSRIDALAADLEEKRDTDYWRGEPGKDGAPGAPGEPGADGYSPTASVTKNGGTATITVTDKNGTTTATVSDGAPGKDGSDATATDVRIAGKSITTDGVADIPIASNGKPGILGVYGFFGLGMGTSLNAYVVETSINEINNRSSPYKPVTPHTMDYAVKAAMCDGKGAAWTDGEQQAARERMNAADANKVYIMQKQIENLQGIAATEETDSTEAYIKTVPTGAQKWASLDKVGGKTVVNDGELVSAEVVEVESKGKNLARNGITKYNYSTDYKKLNENSANFVDAGTYTISNLKKYGDAYYIQFFNEDKTIIPVNDVAEHSVTSNVGWDSLCLYGVENTETITINRDCIMTVCGTGDTDNGTMLQIERGATATAYSPYGVKGTFPIPAEVRDMCPGYGWSAGTVCNEIDFGRKVYVQRVGSVDLGTLDWRYGSSLFSAKFNIKPPSTLDARKDGLICDKYQADKQISISFESMTDKTMLRYSDGTLFVKDEAYTDSVSFKAAMQGVLLYYELAKPIEVDLSDVLTDDHFIEVEAGGTVTFKQASTQLPVPSSVTYQISTSEVIANA